MKSKTIIFIVLAILVFLFLTMFLIGYYIIKTGSGTIKIGNTIYKDGAEIKFFSEECVSLNTDNDAYCEEKSMFGSLHRPREAGKTEIYPNQHTICYYYCVDEENYQKQASDESNFGIECTVPSDENSENPDFILTRHYSYGKRELGTLNIGYKINTPIRILSVVGKNDFSGEAKLVNSGQTRTTIVYESNWFEGIINTKPNQKISNGIIEITYEKEKVEKIFTSVCKTTP
jgi:hypothetical protein